MENELLNNEAIKFFLNCKNKINATKCTEKFLINNFKNYEELFSYLDKKFDHLRIFENLSEILYCIKNNLKPKKCIICGNYAIYYGFSRGYGETCSHSCHCKLQMNRKYSNEYFNVKEKEKHPEYFYDWNIISGENDKWILKHFIRFNRKNFCPDTNKLENGMWSKNEKNKPIIKYILNRFNKSSIEENLYWLYHNLQNDPICPVCGNKLKFINFIVGYQRVCSRSCAALHPDTRKKLKETNNLKYGKDFYLGTNDCVIKTKQTLKNKYKNEIFSNKKQNSPTKYSSKGELKIFQILNKKYPDVIQYYRDKRYSNPRNNYQWECDFYIPSLDLFIEYQGFRSHGPHPYNKNSETDKNFLAEWKNKLNNSNISEGNKNIIKNDIECWTKHDVFKRKIAELNDLKFIEIFEKNINKLNEEYIFNLIDEYLKE